MPQAVDQGKPAVTYNFFQLIVQTYKAGILHHCCGSLARQ